MQLILNQNQQQKPKGLNNKLESNKNNPKIYLNYLMN